MSLSRARARYLSAIGAVLPTLATTGCKDPPAQVAIGEAGVTVAATATPPPTPPPPPHLLNMPSCPSGAFCTVEDPKVGAKDAAPAPFAKCAAVATHPEDASDSGFRGRSRSVTFSAANTTAERAKTPSACCYTWVIPCPGGRAFRDATGTPSVARTTERHDWSATLGLVAVSQLTADTRASLAARWVREAAFEHASIASFAQLTLDLLGASAPPELLAETQRAALDEIEHARIAFAIATAYGGVPVGPSALAALPGACRSLAHLARTTFVDACIGESVASAALAEEARNAADPVLRDVLTKMADDEERHAELAWRIVAWAMKEGDPAVIRELAAAQADVIAELVSASSDDVTSSANAIRLRVLREVVVPCSLALLSATEPVLRSLGTAPIAVSSVFFSS